MYGNALEALIGAIYIDKGFEHCHRFISAKIIEKYVMLDKLAGQEVNFKSRLLEWGQKEKIAITFDLVDYYTGEDGKPVFRTSVMLENHVIATATGNTKKESQQSASKTAMHKIKKDRKLQMLVDQRK
jgi:ribonuclease-3